MEENSIHRRKNKALKIALPQPPHSFYAWALNVLLSVAFSVASILPVSSLVSTVGFHATVIL